MVEARPPESEPSMRRVAANTLLMSGAEIVGRICSLLAVVHLSRALLPAGMGVLDLGIAVFVVVQNVARGGVELLAIQEATRSPAPWQRLAGLALAVSELWTVAALAVVLPALWVAGISSPSVVAAFAVAAVATPLTFRFAWTAEERLGIMAVATVFSLAAFLAISLAWVRTPEHLVRLGAVWIAVELLRVLLPCAGFLRRHGRPRFAFDAGTLRGWLRLSAPVTLSRLMRGIWFGFDILLLGVVMEPAIVGLYGAAQRIPRLLSLLEMMFFTSAFAPVARLLQRSEPSALRELHGSLTRIGVGVALPGCLAISAVATPLVVLVFGEAFAAAGPLLQVLIWRPLLLGLYGHPRNVVLVARPALDLRLTLLALAATGVAAWLLIPRFSGMGVALASVVGEIVLVVGYVGAARDRVGVFPRIPPGWWLRLAVGLAAIVAVAVASSGWDPLARCLAVVAAAGAVVLLVGAGDFRRILREGTTSAGADAAPTRETFERPDP